VVVCRLDRLARSTRDLLNTLDRFSKDGIAARDGDRYHDTAWMPDHQHPG
jgi:DNA invertase Pin-like site-specific DNA recombinase